MGVSDNFLFAEHSSEHIPEHGSEHARRACLPSMLGAVLGAMLVNVLGAVLLGEQILARRACSASSCSELCSASTIPSMLAEHARLLTSRSINQPLHVC